MLGETHYEEKELLLLINKGNERAFETVFNLYWDQVFQHALRLTKSPELAKDLAQDIFVKLWNNRGMLIGIENFGGFLYTVSRNLIFDYLNKKVLVTENEDYLLSYLAETSGTPQEIFEYKDLQKTMQLAIDSLPPKLKSIYILSRIEGLSHEQISMRLGITYMTSKSYMVRALQKIREYLEENKYPICPILLVYLSVA